MCEFVKTNNNGILYVDRILFEAYYPVLFSCKNDRNDIFIVVCCQNNVQGIKWMVGKTTPLDIVRMLRNEITIRELITEYTSVKFSIDYKDKKYTCKYEPEEWKEDSIYLPKEDSYIMAEPGEFDKDIEYFLSIEGRLHYTSQSEYHMIVDKTEQLEMSPAVLVGEFSSIMLSPDRGTNISGEIIRTVQTAWATQSQTIANSSRYGEGKDCNIRFVNENFEIIIDDCFSHEDFENVNINLKKGFEYNLPNAA